MTVVALCCAGMAAWLWVSPPEAKPSRLDGRLDRTEAPGRGLPRRALLAIGSLLVITLLGALVGPAAAAVGAALLIGAGAATRLVRLGRRTRAVQTTRVAVANGCSVIANQVRVGRIPAEALTLAAEDCPVLASASRVQRTGGDVVAALLDQASSPGCQGLRDLARAWQIGTRTGAPMADLLDQVARALRSDQSVERTVTAELAGPRATGRVMAVLPVCGIGLGYLLGGDPIGFLLAGPLGWGCLVIGSVLAALGVLWIEWLARQVVSTT